MNRLLVEASDFTPKLDFDAEKHVFLLEGVSRPENVINFYQQAVDWLKLYESEVIGKIENKYSINKITIQFKLQYFNSASAKSLLQILQSIKSFEKYGMNVVVDFYYDEGDEQMREDGEELAEAIEMEFNYHEVI